MMNINNLNFLKKYYLQYFIIYFIFAHEASVAKI
jgi:hypothetical protein